MERLTERSEKGTAMVRGCGVNCKYGLEFCGTDDWENCKMIDDVVDKLAAYEDAEEQGRMLIFPCRKGDKIYEFDLEDKLSKK